MSFLHQLFDIKFNISQGLGQGVSHQSGPSDIRFTAYENATANASAFFTFAPAEQRLPHRHQIRIGSIHSSIASDDRYLR